MPGSSLALFTALAAFTVGALASSGCSIPNPQYLPPARDAAPPAPDLRAADVGAPDDLAAVEWLSDKPFASMQNGSGPVERDRSNGGSASGDGGPLRIGGVSYGRGLGTTAPSEIRFTLGRAYQGLAAEIGIDDETGGQGSAVFMVFADGLKAYDSGVLRGGQAAGRIGISLAGVDQLRLLVLDAGDGSAGDHADWAVPRLLR